MTLTPALPAWLLNTRADNPKKPYGDVSYADPGYQSDGKKRYPLDSAEHCRAAWSYINMPKNAAKYSPDQLKKIKSRIVAAGRKYGISFEYGEQEKKSRPGLDLCIRAFNFEFTETRSVGDGRTLEGYAAVFNAPTKIRDAKGDFEETIMPGAFTRSLKARMPVLQFEHGRDPRVGAVPIGAVQDLYEDRRGLYVRARLFDNPVVEPVRQAIAGKAIRGMSFRFGVPDGGDNWPKANQREIRDADVHELGPVVFPAYDQTSVGVRSMLAAMDPGERRTLVEELAEEIIEAVRHLPGLHDQKDHGHGHGHGHFNPVSNPTLTPHVNPGLRPASNPRPQSAPNPDLRPVSNPKTPTKMAPAKATPAANQDSTVAVRGRRVEQAISQYRKTLSTDVTHTTADGAWTVERARQHREIVNDLYARAANVPNDGQAVIAGGLGGAGKSTVLKKFAGINPDNYLTINPDDIKEEMARRGMIPEVPGHSDLSPMERAALIHEESSTIAKMLADRAYRDRKNVIWDITMSSEGGAASRMAALDRNGYTSVEGVFVDIPVEVSVDRAMARYARGLDQYNNGAGLGGRYVPPAIIRAQRSSGGATVNREVFDTLRNRFTGGWSVYDNSVAGRAPQLVASSKGGASG